MTRRTTAGQSVDMMPNRQRRVRPPGWVVSHFRASEGDLNAHLPEQSELHRQQHLQVNGSTLSGLVTIHDILGRVETLQLLPRQGAFASDHPMYYM